MHIERIMDFYSEALEELMDAQEYLKKSDHASDTDTKAMYKSMARQELEHQQMLCKAALRIVSTEPPESPLHAVWRHLSGHLNNWHNDIEKRIA